MCCWKLLKEWKQEDKAVLHTFISSDIPDEGKSNPKK